MSKRKIRSKVDLLPFPETPPQIDVEDPRWPEAFSAWCQRKAEWYGLEDAMEMMGRALGIKSKTMDVYRDRKREERRAQHRRLEDLAKSSGDIYGGAK